MIRAGKALTDRQEAAKIEADRVAYLARLRSPDYRPPKTPTKGKPC